MLRAAAGSLAADAGRRWAWPRRSSCWRSSGQSRCWRCWRTCSASRSTCRCWTHLRVTASALGKHAAQFLFTLVFLPYDAYISLDAIVRTLVRMLWTKTKTAGVEDLQRRRARRPRRSAWLLPLHVGRRRRFPPRRSCSLILYQPDLLPAAGPLLGLWLVSPLVAWWLSRPLRRAAGPPVRRAA